MGGGVDGKDLQPEDKGCVKKVVLTGGPCGGKTTVQSVLTETFEQEGWKVFHVPETATLLLNGGIVFSEMTDTEAFSFQENLLLTMLAIEKTFFDLAKLRSEAGKKVIVICDRGAMDPAAYMDAEGWRRMISKNNLTEVELRDARYDCVIHMVTAADGAEEYYSNANNAIRSEGVELARELDKKTANAWVGHPYYDLIDNSSDFQTKLQRVVAAVKKRLQIEDKRGENIVKRKFLLAGNPLDARFTIPYQDFDVQHDYLLSESSQTRLRKRGQNGVYTFTVTTRRTGTKSQKIETRRDVSGREYEAFLLQKDSSLEAAIKTRRCFLWNNQYYQIDYYHSPHKGLSLLEAYMPIGGNLKQQVDSLPPFLVVEREVTDDASYSMFNLCKKPAEQKQLS